MSIADELITRGWTTGRLEEHDGSVCLLGAAAYAAGVDVRAARDASAVYGLIPHACVAALAAAVKAESTDFVDEITFFNDIRADRDGALRVAKLADEILADQ